MRQIQTLLTLKEDKLLTKNFQEIEIRRNQIIQSKIKSKTSNEWLKLFTEEGILTSPVNSLGDWLKDPHVNAINAYSEVNQPNLGKIPIAFLPGGIPLKGIAPGIGSNTEEILSSNGFSKKDINDLISKRIILSSEAEDE